MAAEKDVSEAIPSVVAMLPNIQKLKPEQEQSLLSFGGGHDVVALLPTGFGKSLLFQLAPLAVKELAKANASDANPMSRPNFRKQDSKAQAPRFPKTKDEGWFLVLGEVDRRELLAVKRVAYVRHRTAVSVAFYTPEKTGKCIYTLYLMSDSYLGLDQQYDIHLNVTPASISAQVNSEVSDSVTQLSLKGNTDRKSR